MPIAIKDLLETKDMPTEMGCEAYRGNATHRDNAAVWALREAGDLRIERHSAFRDIVQGAQDFRRAAGLDEIAVSACLESGEDFFTVVKRGQDEDAGIGRFFPDQADALQIGRAHV